MSAERGAVASGHPLTTRAGCEMLARGGNAFDALVASALASTVTEPNLTSLGGGGFLLTHEAGQVGQVGQGRARLYDFFVNAPGLGLGEASGSPEMQLVSVRFRSSSQPFYAGWGTVAVPGMLRGLVECHGRLGTMDMADIVAPALRYLEGGVEATEQQRYLLGILEPILTLEDYGREIFGRPGGEGLRLYNPLLGEFLGLRDPSAWLDRMYGAGARALAAHAGARGGRLTEDDLREYSISEREPLVFEYRGHEILTNPPPSFGGRLIREALGMMQGQKVAQMGAGQSRVLLSRAMRMMNGARHGAGGTTHISVIDALGNAASLTSSNGSNSGCFMPGTGIMMNNMMGEDDLHPDGIGYPHVAGARVGSMMSPTLIRCGGRLHAALGSGGSKRIRSAMLQVIHNLIDRGYGARDAVEAPRIHVDDEGVLQVEPGLSMGVMKALNREFDALNVWEDRDLYFGGVHVVMGDMTGAGDSRRSGSFEQVGDLSRLIPIRIRMCHNMP